MNGTESMNFFDSAIVQVKGQRVQSGIVYEEKAVYLLIMQS